ncbi:calmodulin [Drosophila nasuta]|uniref:Calmodulin n=1 Tax=Drosophila albomicans TaxID=7291 RepID=A0A9C6T5Y3_DROAB|nr:calmodulin [Drosophila albomicans]XP_060654476.1 calmodulin [Drosophila nasuta]
MDELTTEQLGYFKEIFQLINIDADNSITYRELEDVCHAIGAHLHEAQVQSMINEADTDGNGSIEFQEFVEVLLLKMTQPAPPDELRDAYYIFDKDKNGFIGTAELRSLYISLGSKMSDEDIEDMIREADEDQDGVISLDEFINMMPQSS